MIKRKNYAKLPESFDMPNLVEIQTKSYEEFLQAVAMILKLETELTIDIDLRDGIKESDGFGWVQLIVDQDGMEKMSPGIGGFEIGPKITMEEPYSILLTDKNSEPMARFYLKVEVRGQDLYLSLGDGECMIAQSFRREVYPDGVNKLNKPTGALRFLASLTP